MTKYVEIMNIIAGNIDSGKYKAGSVLPTERELPYLVLARISPTARLYRQAEEAARRALAITPSCAEAYVILGDLAQKRCDKATARSFYAQAIGVSPAYWGAYAALGNMQARAGELADAERSLGKARALAPGEPEVYVQLARLEAGRGRPEKALDYYLQALRLDASAPDVYAEAVLLASERGIQEKVFAARLPGLAQNPAFGRVHGLDSASGDLSEQLVQRRIEKDFIRICALARKHGAKVILSSYPEESLPGAQAAAERSGELYLDLVEPFRRNFKSRRDYLFHDNKHCNSSGYGFMARQYAGAVLELVGMAGGEKNGE